MLRASVAAESAGIPAVSIVTGHFMTLARAVAKGLGVADPAIAEYPGVPMIDTDEQLRDKAIKALLPQILEGWSKRTQEGPRQKVVAEPAPRDIVFKGTFQQVQDFFDEKLWADGLPVAPPTIARVEEFLKFTDRAPDEVIGICHPDYREATIWNIAVNGIMAGCRPEYMPVLIAVVEAMVDPTFRLEDAGSTPGWEPQVIVNGPIIKELDFNYGGGVMRAGRRANTSIGRFVRLFIRNLAGQRIPAGGADEATGLKFGGTDKASIGMPFNIVLAENEDAVAELGWEPFSVDRGFARNENVVTVQSVTAVTQPFWTAGKEALNHVQIISEVLGFVFHSRSFGGIRLRQMYPLIVMSPSVAKAIADDGWTKDDIRKYLYDNVKTPAAWVEKYARAAGSNDYDLKEFVKRGIIPKEYYESDDPNRLVRVLVKPELTGIVVAGDPGRNQSKGFAQNHVQGAPVSKKIGLPHDWRQMLKQSKKV